MKRTIRISGIIVGVLYDSEAWYGSAIAAGRITPCSRFRRALDEAADAGDEVEVEVNSYGGDVFAGNDMIAAFQAFKGRKSVTVGGLAASMAANFVLQCGAPVTVHANSILLFHSAYSDTVGGAEAHRDSAALIDQINSPVAKALKAKGVPAGIVDAAFAEGRQLTLTGEDAKRYGLAETLVGGTAAKPEPLSDGAALRAMSDLPKLAASAAQLLQAMPENNTTTAAPAAAADPATKPATTKPAAAAAANPAPDPAKAAADALAKAEANAAALLARAEAAEKALDEAKKAIAQHEASALELKMRADALAKDLASERENHAKLVGHVLGGEAAPTSWPEAVKRLGSDAALRQYPELAKAFRAQFAGRK